MHDSEVDEISVRFIRKKTLVKWRYLNGPYHYRWFDAL